VHRLCLEKSSLRCSTDTPERFADEGMSHPVM